jgi:hypothetical protein
VTILFHPEFLLNSFLGTYSGGLPTTTKTSRTCSYSNNHDQLRHVRGVITQDLSTLACYVAGSSGLHFHVFLIHNVSCIVLNGTISRFIKKNLNFPYANMKWFVCQWENAMILLFHSRKTRIKLWNIGPTIPLQNFRYFLLIQLLIRQRFPLFSLQGMPEKFRGIIISRFVNFTAVQSHEYGHVYITAH